MLFDIEIDIMDPLYQYVQISTVISFFISKYYINLTILEFRAIFFLTLFWQKIFMNCSV